MNKILAFVFLISYYLPASAQVKAEKQVQNAITGFFEALSNRDTASIKAHCTKDILIFENGAVWTVDTLVLKTVQNTAADFKRINTLGFINTEVNEDIAWVTYHNEASILRNGLSFDIRWLETVILVKQEKQWKIKLLHSTLIKRS